MLRELLRHPRRSPEKRCTKTGSHSKERVDRTQEVAGSSPASSMRNRRKSAVFLSEHANVGIQALGREMHSDAPLRGFPEPVRVLLRPHTVG
jgi:hypothetical protein